MLKPLLLIFSIFLFYGSYAQVSILSSSLSSYNVTANSVIQSSVSNTAANAQIIIEAQITNAANEVLVLVRSEPIVLHVGLNVFGPHNIRIQQTQIGSSPQAKFIETQHRLPSGNYNHCIKVIPVAGVEEPDEYCNQINAEEDGFLYLVNPIDFDTIDTKRPLLLWMHSEPFNLLSQGEFFKMTLVALDDNQTAQEGITTNSPLLMKNYLTRHELMYPFDSEELEEGKRYGWQVQKISNGSVINQTESWEFVLAKKEDPIDHLYVQLKPKSEGKFYEVQNERIYFRFDEKYNSQDIKLKIITDQGEKLDVSVDNLKENSSANRSAGYNKYILDVGPMKLKQGYYKLEATNEKSEKFLLNFHMH